MRENDKVAIGVLGTLAVIGGALVLIPRLRAEKEAIKETVETLKEIREVREVPIFPVRVEEIALDTARTNRVFSYSGSSLKVVELTGTASIRLNRKESRSITLSVGKEIYEMFNRFYLTNTAQSGKILKIEIRGVYTPDYTPILESIKDQEHDIYDKLPDPEPLEGDYSAWAQKWISAATTSVLFCINKENCVIDTTNNRIYVRDQLGTTIILNLVNGTIISEENLGTYAGILNAQELASSILNKYVVVRQDDTNIRVYKNSVLLQTITVAGITIAGVAISKNGKYIVFHDHTAFKFYCYEGS